MDVFYENMRRTVEKFYDTYHPGDQDFKEDHLDALQRLYSFERFASCDDLEK